MAGQNESSSSFGGGLVVVIVIAVIAASSTKSCRSDGPDDYDRAPAVASRGAPQGIQWDSTRPDSLLRLDPAGRSATLRGESVRNDSRNPSASTEVRIYFHTQEPGSSGVTQSERGPGELLGSMDLGEMRSGATAPHFSKSVPLSPPETQARGWLSLELLARGEDGSRPDPAPPKLVAPCDFRSLDWINFSERSHHAQAWRHRLWVACVIALFPAAGLWVLWRRLWRSAPAVPVALTCLLVTGAALAVWRRGWSSLVDWPLPTGRAIAHLLSHALRPVPDSSGLPLLAAFSVMGAVLAGSAALLRARRHFGSLHRSSLSTYRTGAIISVMAALSGIAVTAGLSWRKLSTGTQPLISAALASASNGQLHFRPQQEAELKKDIPVPSPELQTKSEPEEIPVPSPGPQTKPDPEEIPMPPPEPETKPEPEEIPAPPPEPEIKPEQEEIPVPSPEPAPVSPAPVSPEPVPSGFGLNFVLREVPGNTGMFLTHIQPGSPADLSGLAPGDEVTFINGARVTQLAPWQITGTLRDTERASIVLRVRRRGVNMEFPMTAAVPGTTGAGGFVKGYILKRSPSLHRLNKGVDFLNVRSAPREAGQITGRVFPHESLTVLGEAEISSEGSRWVPVRIGNLRGWVNFHFLRPVRFPR